MVWLVSQTCVIVLVPEHNFTVLILHRWGPFLVSTSMFPWFLRTDNETLEGLGFVQLSEAPPASICVGDNVPMFDRIFSVVVPLWMVLLFGTKTATNHSEVSFFSGETCPAVKSTILATIFEVKCVLTVWRKGRFHRIFSSQTLLHWWPQIVTQLSYDFHLRTWAKPWIAISRVNRQPLQGDNGGRGKKW